MAPRSTKSRRWRRCSNWDTAVPQGMALVCKQRYASEAMSMSDQDDWEFAGPDDAKAEIRAAVGIC